MLAACAGAVPTGAATAAEPATRGLPADRTRGLSTDNRMRIEQDIRRNYNQRTYTPSFPPAPAIRERHLRNGVPVGPAR